MTNYAGQWNPNGPYGIVKANEVEGGLHDYTWDKTEYATVEQALEALVPVDRRTPGMIVRARELTNTVWVQRWWDSGGDEWLPVRDAAKQLEWGVYSGLIVSITGGGTTLTLAAGAYCSRIGEIYTIDNPIIFGSGGSAGTYVIYLSETCFPQRTLLSAGVEGAQTRCPIAVGVFNGTNWTSIEMCRYMATGFKTEDHVTVSKAGWGNFTTVRQALLWLNCFGDAYKYTREVRVLSDVTEAFSPAGGGCISFAETVFAGAATRLEGLRIVGHADTTTGTYTRILFGSGATKGFFLDVNFTPHVEVSGLQFVYSGTPDDGDEDATVFKNLGKGSHIHDCVVVNGTGTLTHFAYWYNAGAITLGGADVADDSNGVLFDRLNLESAVVLNGVLLSLDSAAGSVTGKLTVRDCTLTADSSYYYSLLFVNSFDDGASFSPIIDNVLFNNCANNVLVPGDYAKTVISNSRFASMSAYRDISAATGDFTQISNCLYTSNVSVILGAKLYANCNFPGTNETITIANANCQLTNCARAGLPFGNVAGLTIASRFDGTQRSQILQGCELGPYAIEPNSSPGTFALAAACVEPGVILFPNGLVGTLTTAITRSLTTSAGVKRQDIAGSNGWTDPSGTAADLFFYWFLRLKKGETVPVLRFDTVPPDVYGQPGNTPAGDEAAYAKADYAYVGTLQVFDNNAGGTSLENGIFKCFFGGAYVQHFGQGLRKFGTATCHLTTSDLRGSVTGAGITTGNASSLLVFNNAFFTNLVHALGFGWSLRVRVQETGVNTAQVAITAGGLVYQETLAMSGDITRTFNIETPICGATQSVEVRLDNYGAGTVSWWVDRVIHTIIENTNRLRVRQQGVDM